MGIFKKVKNILFNAKDGKGIKQEFEALQEYKKSRRALVDSIVIVILEKNVSRYPKHIELLKSDIEDNKEMLRKAKVALRNVRGRQEYMKIKEEFDVLKEAVNEGNAQIEATLKVIENALFIDGEKLKKLKNKNSSIEKIENTEEAFEELHELRENSSIVQAKENMAYAITHVDELIASLKDSKKYLVEVKKSSEKQQVEFTPNTDKKDAILEKMLIAFTNLYEKVINKLNDDDYEGLNLKTNNIGYIGYDVKGFAFEFGIGEQDIVVYGKGGEVLFADNRFAFKEMVNLNKLYISLVATNHIN